MCMCSWSQQSLTPWFHSGANWCLPPPPIVNSLGDPPKVTYKLAYPCWAYFQTTSLPLLPLPHLFTTPQRVFIENTGQYSITNVVQPNGKLPCSPPGSLLSHSILAFMQAPSEPWLTSREAHVGSAAYWQNFGLELTSNTPHWTLAALKNHGQETILGCSIARWHFTRRSWWLSLPSSPLHTQYKWLHFLGCALN